jgi:hypothetical protein
MTAEMKVTAGDGVPQVQARSWLQLLVQLMR